MWMPAGIHTIVAGFRKGSIELTVQCDESTVDAVQASLENWRAERPKQESFGCIEHRETEASFRVGASGCFKWNEDGVYLTAEPTVLGAQNVNGKIHRSWSPSFTTDADYASATEVNGTLVFPDGVRGSRSNPARITGTDFVVGTLTNKPAFHAMSPVKSREAVMASGTSEGAKKGWEHRERASLFSSHAEELSKIANRTGLAEDHLEAEKAHSTAWFENNKASKAVASEDQALSKDLQGKAIQHGEKVELHKNLKRFAKASDTTPSSTITAHCKDNLLRDVPDATKAEIAQYEKLIDDGGAHGDAVYELRKERKNGFVSTSEPTLDSIYEKVSANQATANRLAEENGVAKLTAQDVYERHTVRAGGTSEGAKKGWEDRKNFAHKLSQTAERATIESGNDGSPESHQAAANHHISANRAHASLASEMVKEGSKAEGFHHQRAAAEHWDKVMTHLSLARGRVATASDTTPSSTITAHCKENLLRDVPDATKAEIAQYEKHIDEGGDHASAVYELRKERKNGFVSTQEKPTLDSILNKVTANLNTANRLAEENGVCKLTAQDVYERHTVRAGGTSEGAKKGWGHRVHVVWTDRNYEPHRKTFYNDPDGSAGNAHTKAKKFGEKLESEHAKSKYGSLRDLSIHHEHEDDDKAKASDTTQALESIYARAGANR
jgi:hypothetical protein